MARGIDPVIIGEAETVASELVANAVKHAKALGDGCVRVRWKVKSGTVEVEVSDGGGPTGVRPVPPSPWAVSYTHLDVYKRQPRARSGAASNGCARCIGWPPPSPRRRS